jgi:hypothetical protein
MPAEISSAGAIYFGLEARLAQRAGYFMGEGRAPRQTAEDEEGRERKSRDHYARSVCHHSGLLASTGDSGQGS